jgi:hypothetical protein
MALFGSKKKTTTLALTKIRPTVLRTQNVAKELLSLAKSYDVKVDTIDFNILEVQTYTRMNDSGKDSEWEEIFPEEIYELDDETALLNPHFQIKQMYEIEFFSKKNDDNEYSKFNIAIGANATKCKIYLSIKEGSEVSYTPRFEKELLVMINKAKVRAGILINIFDEMLNDTVSKISATVRVEEHMRWKKTETYLIAESYEPTKTIHDELILHYENKKEVSENKKIDYASRGFIQSVLKDDVIIEYIKPKLGKPGRNCRGEFMTPKEIETSNIPKFTVDETIREEETPKSIQYIANENGYIALEGSVYTIKSEVDVDEITFKTTGNITSGIDSDVNIVVTEADAVKDAIGNGMIVEVSEIEIEGNVGSNAKLKALKAYVGGQTHKTSLVEAQKININIHKGTAIGKNIHITRLEHGSVEGEKIDITQALGGHISGQEIEIELCASHVKATASRVIEIKKLHGSENTFVIDPLLQKDVKESLDEDTEDIKALEEEERDLKKEIEKYRTLIKNNTAAFNDVKKRLLHYKKNGVKMPESFVKKYKQFQNMKDRLATLEKSYDIKNDKLKLLTNKTSTYQDNIFDARIINRDRWIGFNELIFKLVDPPIEVSYKPAEGFAGKEFALVEVEEGEYEIKAVDL